MCNKTAYARWLHLLIMLLKHAWSRDIQGCNVCIQVSKWNIYDDIIVWSALFYSRIIFCTMTHHIYNLPTTSNTPASESPTVLLAVTIIVTLFTLAM